MSFISKEDIAAVRNKSGTKIELNKFIDGLEKSIVVCEVSLNDGIKLKSASDLPAAEKVEFVLDAVSTVVFDEHGTKLTRQDINDIFGLTSMEKGTQLLDAIQDAAFKAKGPAGN